MPIEGFDFKAFAENLSGQAAEILGQTGTNAAPSSLTDEEKSTIITTVKRFCLMAGEALYNDSQISFNADQASLVTQFIGEWTFHKSIDLSNGKIPNQFRESILQVIAANIFNTAKLAIIKQLPDDTLINLIEEKVGQVYKEELEKLVKKGALSQEHYNRAVNSSNLNDMVQKVEEDKVLSNIPDDNSKVSDDDKKVLKLVALAVVMKRLPQAHVDLILSTLDKTDVVHVTNYMKMSNIENKIDHSLIIKVLNEIRQIIPLSDAINIPRLLKRHNKIKSAVPPDILSKIALSEREAVRDFIMDETFPVEEVFAPQVIKSLVCSVEEKINDYQKKVCKY